MDVSFETRLPMASLQRDAREFFGARQGLTFRDEGGGAMSFAGSAGTVRLTLTAGASGTVRVQASTTTLDDLVRAFRERVAPQAGHARRARLAANEDLERFRRLAERQSPPPKSTQTQTVSSGGGRYPG